MEFRWTYTGVRVQDVDAALRFYVQGLGMRMRFQFRIKETRGRILELVSGDGKHFLELNWYPPGSEHATPYVPGEALDHFCFKVKDATLGQAIAHLEQHGGRLTIPVFKEGKSVLAYVDSPDGHTIELSQSQKGAARAAKKAPAKPKTKPKTARKRAG